MTERTHMINPQCKLCQLGVGLEEGLSQREIAKKYGIGSKSSVGRHLAHYKENAELINEPVVVNVYNPDHEPLIGTIDASSINPALLQSEEKTVETEDEATLDDLIKAQGDDPSEVEITAKEVKSWDAGNGEVRKSYRVAYKPSVASSEAPLDIPSLFARAKAAKPSKTPSGREDRALVVIWADTQTGKVDRNGGTPELIERIKGKQEAL